MPLSLRAFTMVFFYLVSSLSARAEITVEDTWNNLIDYAAIYGGQLSGTLEKFDGTLNVTNVIVTFSTDGTSGGKLAIGDISLSEQEDGSVSLTHSESQMITFTGFGHKENQTVSLRLDRSGFSMIATGTPNNVTYNTTANTLLFELLDITSQEPRPEGEVIEFAFLSEGLNSTTTVNTQSGLGVVNTADHDTLLIDIIVQEDADERQRVAVAATNVTSGYSTQYTGSAFAWSDIVSALQNGLSLGVSLEADTYQLDATLKEPGEPVFDFAAKTHNLSSAYALDVNGWAYKTQGHFTEVSVPETQDIPFPITLTLEGFGFDTRLPVMASDNVQEFPFKIWITDLKLPNDLWDMIDPTHGLPRDPVTARFDSSYELILGKGLLDDLAPSEPSESSPPAMTIDQLSISDLYVSALGAELSGSGSFSLDNSDLVTFSGIPAPTGKSSLKLSGTHALIDKLVTAKTLTESDALSARAMMGIFMRPGDAPDTLTSEIEINGMTGSVVANGVRVK